MAGERPMESADATRAIVCKWLDDGYTISQISEASCMSPNSIRHIRDNAIRVSKSTARAVSAVTKKRLDEIVNDHHANSNRAFAPIGLALDRIRELTDRGYSINTIADAAGINRGTIDGWLYCKRKMVKRTLYDAIMGLDDKALSASSGRPSRCIDDGTTLISYKDTCDRPQIYHELMPRPDGNQWIAWQRMGFSGDQAKWGKWSKTEAEAIDTWNEMVVSDGRKFDRQKHLDEHNERINKNLKFNDLPTYEFTPGQIRKYITNNAAY